MLGYRKACCCTFDSYSALKQTIRPQEWLCHSRLRMVQSLQITGVKRNVLFLQRASTRKLINRSMQNVSRSGEKGWNDDNSLSSLICTHYPGHINLNIKLNAWMLSYILRETSISFLPESVRYYNSQYISLRPVKIHQRKQSHLRSHNTSHSSFFQKSFP